MILTNVKYSEFEGKPESWSLDDFCLGKINLVVGKNSTGKTRITNIIAGLSDFASGKSRAIFDSANYDFKFSEGDNIYRYILTILEKEVVREIFYENGYALLDRNGDGTCTLYFEKEKKNITIQIPDKNQIAVFARRDTIQHPFLEKIFSWANELRLYRFGSSLGRNYSIAINAIQSLSLESINQKNTEIPVAIFILGLQKFQESFQKRIVAYMQEIGFDISDVSVNPDRYTRFNSHEGIPLLLLYVTEKGVKVPISQRELSQGIFRALSLIIQLTFNILEKTASTILIDDIGEGLDFDRSSKLIKLLIEIAEKNDNIQLIISTNDRFVMNNVPLEYWQLIQRSGGECKVFNYQNSKEKFDEFEYMGLNNFDFLATDYLNSEWQKI
jgi:energy-coupling factor transporter ATP-binding protein EcfA2